MTGSASLKNRNRTMKRSILHPFLAAGAALAAIVAHSNARADVEILFTGGNASQTVLYDRVTNILTGGISSVTISPTNSTVC